MKINRGKKKPEEQVSNMLSFIITLFFLCCETDLSNTLLGC